MEHRLDIMLDQQDELYKLQDEHDIFNISQYQYKSTEDQTVDVTFIHVICPIDSKDKRVQNITICLLRLSGIPVVHSGVAIMNPNDENNPLIGEQYAFKRAVRQGYNVLCKKRNMPFIASVWNKYHTHHRQKLWETRKLEKLAIRIGIKNNGRY